MSNRPDWNEWILEKNDAAEAEELKKANSVELEKGRSTTVGQRWKKVANNRKGGIRRGKIDPAKAAEVDALLGVKPEVPATEVKPEKVKTIIRRGVDRKLAASVDEENSLEKCEAIIEKLEELVKTGEHPSVKSANAKIKQLGLPGQASGAKLYTTKSKGAFRDTSRHEPRIKGGHLVTSISYDNAESLPNNHPDHAKMEELHNHILANHDVEESKDVEGAYTPGDYDRYYKIKGPK